MTGSALVAGGTFSLSLGTAEPDALVLVSAYSAIQSAHNDRNIAYTDEFIQHDSGSG